jgi:TatD DNase family protein
VHTRDAENDTVDMLDKARYQVKGVIHCFSGTQHLADKVLDLGFYISISGIVTFKKSNELREIVKAIPLDKLLLETDAPYLAPVPNRGKRNEPCLMTYTAEVVADLKKISVEELAEATTYNYFQLFSKSK